MTSLKTYSSFIKLEHTLFSLPLLYAGALMAQRGWPSITETLLILIAGGSARIIALVLNRIIDRKIDARNPRTKDRHLSSGKLTVLEASLLGLLSLIIYLFSAWLLSDFCLYYSWIPLLGFAAYPFFKRLTKWTHIGLGLVWSLVPVAGYVAVNPTWTGLTPVLMLSLFSVFWLAGFDIIYATMDEAFDREAGLHSLPARWGAARALRLAGIFHLLSFLILVVFYAVWLSGPITVILLAAIGVLLYFEFQFSGNVNLAFFHVNTIIGFLVLLLVMSGLKGV